MMPSGPPLAQAEAEGVEYTISEDRSAGHAAAAESGFAQLAAPSGPKKEHALEYYHEQLTLLEKQNKKRLALARAEQDMHGGPAMPVGLLRPPNHEAATGEDETESQGTVTDPTGLPHDGDNDTESNTESNRLRVVLYRVACSSRNHKCDDRIYEGAPSNKLIDKALHLAHSAPVSDLGIFIANRGPTAFVVYREVYCGSSVEVRSSLPLSNLCAAQQVQETVSAVSGELHATLQRLSKFAPDRGAYNRGHDYRHMHPRTSPLNRLSNSPSEYSPYFFYHHREVIKQAATVGLGGESLNALWSYLQRHPDPMYARCDELFAQGQVSADTLPWLFQPNKMVVCKEGPLEVAYVLRDVPKGGTSNAVELDCWYWAYDGNALQRKDKKVKLTAPTYDSIPIRQLSAYPLQYANDETRQRLFERGGRFWELRNTPHVSYEGPDYQGERVYPWDSRCMIDYQIYRKFHNSADAFVFSDRQVIAFDNRPREISSTTTQLSQDDTMLLPPGIHGFFLKEKKWVHLLIDNVAPVSWNKQAFDSLVLPGRIKNLVKSLVLVRMRDSAGSSANPGPKERRSDLIRGKGGGLIMLLHGGPGTGKTLTAELAEMPLYNVTCGDVGTKPEAVEKYLSTVLHLGQKWNCVLLLDEADVFLEQRSLSDLKRNSLVSVFLRTLEYYDGILILTSNRVGTFDAAFKSRIQVALHYPSLDQPSRQTIWQNFLAMLRADGEDVDFDGIAAHVDEAAAHGMNGRQIRNAVTTARQLALFEGARLAWDHVEQAIAAASDFDAHVREVGAMSEEEWVMERMSDATGLRGQAEAGVNLGMGRRFRELRDE
ncbi:Fidgetin-like protein 1 [Chaetomidium leptoderma]|uniref:Fidgetin-like protein 1 n=1 Tax=Chaetomidium leptoderma TaxID=669021 RepID=A0AAN6ZXU3_9PEZI|nr:Fidgetin-like protein 1 [Chaetomidium leptoderma]